MRKKRDFIIWIAAVFVASVIFCLIAGSGALSIPDGVVSDLLYQHPSATDGEIVVVGIDQKALSEIGPMPWPRSVIAEAIDYLNSDPEGRVPAVIGVDILYAGESDDPEADSELVRAVSDAGNVVLVSVATFGSALVSEDDGAYIKRDSVLGWDEPYEALKNGAAGVGHINVMEDSDAVLRHGLLYVDVPGEGKVDSFSRVIYEKYCETTGEESMAPPETDSGFFYLPFTAKTGGYSDGISVSDLISGSIEPEFFENKIVLIGPYTVGLQDAYRTSIEHAVPMYGVEIHANIIDAFRKGFFPREAKVLPQLIILFVICFGLGVFFYERKTRYQVMGEIGACGIWIGVCLVMYRAGIILHVIWVPVFVTVMFIASIAMNYMRAAREKRRVQGTFGRYIDPAVMRQLLDKGEEELELGGKEYTIAVLFVDIRGFTTMSEALDPKTVVEIINKYLTLTTKCIMQNHGTVDKFVGDCTMAFWNAPVAQEDPVYLACRAAMDMVEESKALGEELQERFGRSVSFGVGVNWGTAVVGNIGAPLRMDYTAIGDTVNTAARLEANAPGGKVYISRAVADELEGRIKYTSLGDSIKLKGKADGFEVLELEEIK